MQWPTRAEATHAAGGEITYEWVSDSTYRFYFKFYRDCSGIAEPTSASLCYFNSCGSHRGSITLSKVTQLPNGTPNGSEVSPGCADYPTRCTGSGSNLPGYREWWYSGTMTLPARCDYWTFYVSISDRNLNTNIGTGNLYIEATLNNLDVQNNSSPYFSVKPVPYVCVNSPYTFNNGAVDPNGDSLVFEFIRPRTAATACAATYSATDIAYRSTAFSLAEPFSTNNTFIFSNTTGEMTFTPALQSTNTVSVRVSDYRNGVKIGSVMRDVQIQVRACSNPPTSLVPISTSVTGGQLVGGQINGAANQPLRFCYNIVSDSPNRILIVTDNHMVSAPGSIVDYTGQGTDFVTGCFSWVPGCADTGLKILTITVKDSTCEPPGIAVSRTFTLPIYIQSGSVTYREVVICRGEEINLSSTGGLPAEWTVEPGGAPLSSLSCTSCSNPIARPDVTTVYVGKSNSGTCHNTDRIRVRVDNDTNIVTITPESPFVLCKPGYVNLEASIDGPKPLSNLPCGATAQLPPTIPDTLDIVPKNAPIQSAANPGSTPFSGDYNKTSRHQYLFRATDLRASGMYSGTLRSMAFNISSIGAGAVYNNLTISVKCTQENELSQAAGFIEGAVPVYYSTAPVTIPAAGGFVYFDFSIPYNWDTTQNLLIDICYSNPDTVTAAYTYYFNNSYQSTLYSFSSNGSVCGVNSGQQVFSTHELPQVRFSYHKAPEAEFSYEWENGLFEPSSLGQSASVFVSESKKVWLVSKSRHGCTISDTLEIKVPMPFEVFPEDASLCYGTELALTVRNSTKTAWYEDGFNPASSLSCGQCDTPTASPLTDVIYTAVVSNDLGCTDTIYIPVEVRPLPDVRILNEDTLIKYGDEFHLIGSGAERYMWSPPHGLSDAYIADPMASPKRSQTYILTGISDGCFAYDTITVHVDLKGHLFIPNAFTPNGDGQNDVFRIANLKFQKVVEFRVLNRWGKEVFKAEDGALPEWDGTWNGLPQPMDTYYYLIRISYPDGTMETHTGDVILVR